MAYVAPREFGRDVDESLFGKTAFTKTAKATANPAPEAAAAPLALRAGEVTAMRRAALLGDGEAKRAAAEKAALEAERVAVAEARKERIRSLESSRLQNVPLSQLQQEEEDEKRARRALAIALQEERTDAMKSMNSMLNSAITVSIRDRQLAEKRAQGEAAKKEARLLELKAEIESLEAQQRTEEESARVKAHIKVQQKALSDQLAEALGRKRAALEAALAEDKERKASMVAALAEEEAKKAADKARRKAQLQDFKLHNDAAVEARAARRAAELEADRRADAEALVLAAKREAQLQAEEAARVERERILSMAKGNVQKLLDDRDAKEELRARRALELAARADRAAELKRVRERAETEAALQRSREEMAAQKQALMASMIDAEKEEFERAAAAQEEWLERERQAEAAKARASAELLAGLSAQMEEKKAAQRARRAAEAAEEAERLRALEQDRAFLAGIRDKKVAEIKALGVDPLWTQQLARYNSEKITEKMEMSGRPPVKKPEGNIGVGWKK